MRIKVYIACHVVESNVITPIMLSRRLTLNAVVVFLAVVAWGRLWGVSGALMAVPLLALLKVIADRVDGLAGLSEFLGGREPGAGLKPRTPPASSVFSACRRSTPACWAAP